MVKDALTDRMRAVYAKASRAKKGRPPLVTLRWRGLADAVEGAREIARLSPMNATKARIVAEVRALATQSGMRHSDPRLVAVVWRQWRAVLGPGTTVTYLSYAGEVLHGPAYKQAVKAAHRIHADMEENDRGAVTTAALESLCSLASAEMRPVLFLLLATGLRPTAVQQLKAHRIRVKDHQLVINVVHDKNIRCRRARRNLVLPGAWWSVLPEDVKNFFTQNTSTDLLFPWLTTTLVNNEMKRIQAIHRDELAPTRLMTSYCFRKNYINQVFEFCQGDEQEMLKYTLHKNVTTLRAYYIKY
jgi:hypothetical protein